MTSRPLFSGALLLTAALSACASSSSSPGTTEAPVEAIRPGPRDGTNYFVLYADDAGVHVHDTRTGLDSLLLRGVRVTGVPILSPNGSASAFQIVQGDSMALLAVRGADLDLTPVIGGPAGGAITAAWSTDGRLGAGYRASSGGEHAMVAMEADGTVRPIGCSASNRFFAWQGDATAVVGDGRNVYAVSATNCATRTTLPRQGKSDFAFSPDGRRLSFTMAGQQGGLYIAQVSGAGARQVADAQFNPRNARWAPHGNQLAFEIRSREYANVTHVAVHDVPTGEISFADRQTELGMPSDAWPCWSPDGSALLHERRYARSGAAQSYTTRQLVVKAVGTSEERIVLEELIGANTPSFAPSCWWSGPRHVVVRTADSFDVIDVFTSEVFELSTDRRPLLVQALVRLGSAPR